VKAECLCRLARAAHFRFAADLGRSFYVDLTNVPKDRRPAVVDEIKALVERASVHPLAEMPKTSRASIEVDG
jgi:hypothetical protein